MQAVVLAGGLATRLGARARQLPKYLQPVAGRPFACWQLERLGACGLSEVLLCVGQLGDAIEEALGDGAAFGVHLSYARDGDRPLGTGGAVRAVTQRLEPTFLLTYGDTYLPFDYAAPLRDLRAHPEALATMAVYENDSRWDRSNTRVEGDRVVGYDKRDEGARFIDYGAIALRREALERLPAGAPADLGALLTALAVEGGVRAYVATQRFYEIGSPAALDALDEALRTGAVQHPGVAG